MYCAYIRTYPLIKSTCIYAYMCEMRIKRTATHRWCAPQPMLSKSQPSPPRRRSNQQSELAHSRAIMLSLWHWVAGGTAKFTRVTELWVQTSRSCVPIALFTHSGAGEACSWYICMVCAIYRIVYGTHNVVLSQRKSETEKQWMWRRATQHKFIPGDVGDAYG